jgi:hypothetical protein
MDTLLSLLKGAAPLLATAVAGPLGGAAVSLLAKKFDVEDTVAAVAQAIAGDPKAVQKLADAELEFAKLDAADRDSARTREVEMAKAGNLLSQLVVPILALGTVSMTFAFIAALLFLEIKTEQQQLVIFALGYATAAAQQVLSYFFGSSKSSSDKTVAMTKGMTK